jgi:hypothetical protein
MNPTYEFHGYKIIANGSKVNFYKPINDESELLVLKDQAIFAKVNFVGDGAINVSSPDGVRIQGQTITLLSR